MSGTGFGVLGVRGLFALLGLSFATTARAQSTASFPDPAASTPAQNSVAPVAPAAAPVRVPVAAPAPAAAPAPVPAPVAESQTERRYPLASESAAPPTSGSAFLPAILPYRQGLPVPAGYRIEHRSANGLIAAGLASWLVGYGTAIIVGAGDKFKNGTGWTVVPVIGPWAAIAARSYHCENDPLQAQQCVRGAFNEVQTIAILSADAVVQATGAVLFLAGLGSGQAELVRTDLQASVRVTPRTVGASGFGLGFDGRF